MGKLRGFMEYDRINEPVVVPDERIQNYKEFTIAPKNEELQKQGGRCMDCGVPFCHSGCPLGNLIPDFNDAVHKMNGKKRSTFCTLPIIFLNLQVDFALLLVKKLVFWVSSIHRYPLS